MIAPTLVNVRKVEGVLPPTFDIYIGRAVRFTKFTKSSIWHNPFARSLERSLAMYELYMRAILVCEWPENQDEFLDFNFDERDAIARAFRRVVNQKVNPDAPGCGAFKLDDLTGKVMGCWCVNATTWENLKCHGQVLMKLWHENFYGSRQQEDGQ